jgi:hypothetical protein
MPLATMPTTTPFSGVRSRLVRLAASRALPCACLNASVDFLVDLLEK